MPILIGSQTVSVDDIENFAIDFTDKLDTVAGEVLVVTPTVVDANATGNVTISNVQLNSATFLFAKTTRTVAINHAVLFTLEIGTAGTYYLNLEVGTSSTPARNLVRQIRVIAQ